MANVRIYTVSDRPLAAYDSAVDYMQDIQPGSLLQSIHDGVRNPRELYYYLPAALINAKPVRPLEFNSGVEPNNPASFGSKNLWENIQSCLVYITGDEVPQPGGRSSCIKKFPLIVTPKLIYDYHFDDDPEDRRERFHGNKRESYFHPATNVSSVLKNIRALTSSFCLIDWACANHHYDGEWSRCEVWTLLRVPDPRLEQRARARARAVPQPALPQPDAPQAAAPEITAPQSGATQPAASQILAFQPVASDQAPAQPGGQPSAVGALRGTRRGTSRGHASGGVNSRRGANGPSRSHRERQTMLSGISHGFTQPRPDALSSIGSIGGAGDFQTSGFGTASYQMPAYQTPYNTALAQPNFNTMHSQFQSIGPPGSFTQVPFSHPQIHSVYGQTQQTISQQPPLRWVDPRQLTRQQTPAQRGLVSEAAFLQQQMHYQQAVGSATGGSQDSATPATQEYGTLAPNTTAPVTLAVSQHSHENSPSTVSMALVDAFSQAEEVSQGDGRELC